MRKIFTVALPLLTIAISGCSNQKNVALKSDLKNELIAKNRGNISLLERIRQKSGIIVRSNIPYINKNANTFDYGGSQEPLYVLNSQIIGNSFVSVNDLIESFNVKKITVISGAEASMFGTQGGNGVIKIETY